MRAEELAMLVNGLDPRLALAVALSGATADVESSINPKRGLQRLPMGGDSRFDILPEVGVDSCGGVGRHQCDALGDLAAHRLRRLDHSDWLSVTLDDDLGSGLGPLQDRSYNFGQVAFADVRWLHIGNHTVSAPFPRKPRTRALS